MQRREVGFGDGDKDWHLVLLGSGSRVAGRLVELTDLEYSAAERPSIRLVAQFVDVKHSAFRAEGEVHAGVGSRGSRPGLGLAGGEDAAAKGRRGGDMYSAIGDGRAELERAVLYDATDEEDLILNVVLAQVDEEGARLGGLAIVER